MRRLAWLGGALGGIAALRLLRRRAATGPAPTPLPEPEVRDPRAEELRRRLEESRAIVDERDAFEDAETPVDQAESAEPDERRARIHEEARAAVERMRDSPHDG